MIHWCHAPYLNMGSLSNYYIVLLHFKQNWALGATAHDLGLTRSPLFSDEPWVEVI